MGLEHSTPRPPRPRNSNVVGMENVVITRADIPEAYLHVAVSDDVIKRVDAQTKLSQPIASTYQADDKSEKWR